MASKKRKDMLGQEKPFEGWVSSRDVLKQVFAFVQSPKDRDVVSLVCKEWYSVEKSSWTRVFIGNCYSVTPEIVARRFPNIRSVSLKGKLRIFKLVSPNWGADIHAWLVVFALAYPFVEELRLKWMVVLDKSLEFLASSFSGFKALSLVSCDGFSTIGLACIASDCMYTML